MSTKKRREKSQKRVVDSEWFTFGRMVTTEVGDPYLWTYDQYRFDNPEEARKKANTFAYGTSYDVYLVHEVKQTTVTKIEVPGVE